MATRADAERSDIGLGVVMPGGTVVTPTRLVLFIDDVAQVLRTSRSTIERRRRAGTFPVPELPGIDGRPRWSWQAVEQYLTTSARGDSRLRRAPRPPRS
jgi:predicted DNA-binding transcriptional regulator AlpA